MSARRNTILYKFYVNEEQQKQSNNSKTRFIFTVQVPPFNILPCNKQVLMIFNASLTFSQYLNSEKSGRNCVRKLSEEIKWEK